MKRISSHRFKGAGLSVLLVSLALVSLPLPLSTAQLPQDNRQLQRDSTQQTNQSAQRRIALVIGNGAYTNAPPLKNPPNDARDMAATLKALGFEVTSGVNVNQRDMKRLIREFGQKLKGGGSGLFYFAGHGVQSKGKNYLIPIEADIQSEIEVEDSGVDVNLVLGYMDDAQNGLNIVILDACRNNPFVRSFRSASNGLAQVDAPTGTLIAYATAPGRVASDGTGQNGLYTSELLKQMQVPSLSVTDMFMRVRAEVMKQTSGKQVPWEASSLVGSFYFSPMKNSSSTPANMGTTETKIDTVAIEREYWETIRTSSDAQDYKDYLQTYPSGAYAAVARAKIRQIESPKPTYGAPIIEAPAATQGVVTICKEVDEKWRCLEKSSTWKANAPFNILFQNPTPVGIEFIGIVFYRQDASGSDSKLIVSYMHKIGTKNRYFKTINNQIILSEGTYSIYIIDWAKREVGGHRGNLSEYLAKTVLTVN